MLLEELLEYCEKLNQLTGPLLFVTLGFSCSLLSLGIEPIAKTVKKIDAETTYCVSTEREVKMIALITSRNRKDYDISRA